MENIQHYINQNYPSMISLWKQLCTIPAPSLQEDKRVTFCKEWLEGIGAQGVYTDTAKNVIFPVNCEGKNEITLIVAHTDVVFPDLTPLPLREDGENVYCPGAGDDTASLTALLYCAKYIVENNIKPANGLLLVCVSGEEGLGNLVGTRQIMKDFAGRIKQFISFDSNINQITDRCVGSSRYKVTVKTKGGHSFQAFGNKNAIHALSEIVNKIYSLDIPHDEQNRTTVNVGTVKGGTSVNTIAQEAEMLCEYRSDSATYLDIMKAKFTEIFENARTSETEILVENVGERPCARDVDENEMNRLRRITFDIIKEVSGKDPIFKSGSTDCNIPLSLGIPAICIGTYNGGGAHTREEWVNIESMRPGLEIALRTVLELGC